MRTLSKIYYGVFWLAVLCIALSWTREMAPPTTFNLQLVAERNHNCKFLQKGRIYNQPVLLIEPVSGNTAVTIWKKGDEGDWSAARYLVAEVYGFNDYSGVIDLEFFKDSGHMSLDKIIVQGGQVAGSSTEKPWLTCQMGIMPRVKTKIVFPLSYIDAQRLFLPRHPRQLKGTINGNRLDPKDIIKVVLRFGPFSAPYFTPRFELASVKLMEEEPAAYPATDEKIVDSFGQWNLKEWPGKIKDEKALIKQNIAFQHETRSMKFPEGWSRWGGWKGKQFQATGFFRTQFDGSRWWFADPDGYAFLSVGVDCIGLGSSGPIRGMEDIFEWLPHDNDSLFRNAISSDRGGSMDFYKANLIRAWGENYQERWNETTSALMRGLGFNTVGNWSDLNFARQNKLPYVLPMRGFPSTKALIYRDFPDVFSQEFSSNSETFAKQLESFSSDPYLVGYFLRNEPEWAFGYHNLAFEMFATSQRSATKNNFIDWIKEKYKGDVFVFNKAWNLNLSDFGELLGKTFKQYPSIKADEDFYNFSMVMVKRYIDLPCDAVKKVDKNHLNLGMRYAWMSSDLLYKAGERFDVFSINGYGINPPSTADIARISGKPVMIGEFHHGAVDRGLPATGIIGVLTQQGRADAYRNYVEQGFARPELIGMHYFQWIDQPFYGRSDGENYNIGVVSVTNLPYPELTKAMKTAHDRMYSIANGTIKPYNAKLIEIPPIHY